MEEAIVFGLNKLNYEEIKEKQRAVVMGYVNNTLFILNRKTNAPVFECI